jgi:hypothetical protein
MRLSPEKPWIVEPDVMVEDNGAVFLVYPRSDFGRDWLDKDENILKGRRFQAIFKKLPWFNTEPKWERLGDILFVQRPCILGLVKRIVSADLRVVWCGVTYEYSEADSRNRTDCQPNRAIS